MTTPTPDSLAAAPAPRRVRLTERRWFRRLANALILLAVWFAIGAYQTRHHLATSAAPDFSLRDLDGRVHSLRDLRGRKVVVHFFATWCGVCKVELPSVRSLQRGLGEDEALLAIVADSDDPAAVRAFVAEHDIRYPVLLGTPEVLREFGVSAFPTNYYVNRDGSISSSSVGLSTRLGMAARLAWSK